VAGQNGSRVLSGSFGLVPARQDFGRFSRQSAQTPHGSESGRLGLSKSAAKAEVFLINGMFSATEKQFVGKQMTPSFDA
jgi:hypothetical protein